MLAGEQEDLPVCGLALQKAQGQTQAVIVEHDERVIQQERGILRQQQAADGQPDGQIQLVRRAAAQKSERRMAASGCPASSSICRLICTRA